MVQELPEHPKVRGYDLGVVDLAKDSDTVNSFEFPWDGWIYRIGVSWPAGANNVIGVKIVAREGGEVLIPKGGAEYITDDNVYIPFYMVEEMEENEKVYAYIKNASTNSKLDLQVRVLITNFNPIRYVAVGRI